MERKGRTIRRQRRSRSWLFSPMIIAQLAVVMVVAGVGVAFALPQNPVTNTAVPWIGSGTVAQSQNFTVDTYTLSYDATFSNVTGVTLAITKGTGGTTAQLNVVAINGSNVIRTNSSVSVSGTGSVPVTFTAIPIEQLDKINVLLTEP